MKYIILFLAVTTLLSCNNQAKTGCVHPFEFDKATHYTLQLPDSIILDAYDFYFNESTSTNKNKDLHFNREALAFAFDNYLYDISQKREIDSLEDIGFQRTNIKKERFAVLDSMFCYLDEEPNQVAACEPVYRDLIVFEKNNIIIGWVKICLDCGMSEIVGSKSQYDGPTYSLAIGKLHDILKK